MSRRGISLLDLLTLPPGAQSLLPDDLASQLEKFAVVDIRSTTSPAAIFHYGTVQSVADVGLPALRNWPAEIPGLNTGIPFQLSLLRTPPGAGQNLEPGPAGFRLDLFLQRVSIIVPGLRPATRVPASGVTPSHLVADRSRSRVRIVGSGILRLASNPAGGAPIVRFIDLPDPFDPNAPTGPVLSLNFDPPHFYFGDSTIGMTVERLTYDDSETFTPAEIVARGQPASWRGIAIQEATLYLPRNAPVVGDLSIGVRDVLLGSPFGMQGEVRIEFGRSPVDPLLVAFHQQTNGAETLLSPPSGTGRSRIVTFAAGTTPPARLRASLPSGATAAWILPDGSRSTGQATGYFLAREGDVLRYIPAEVVDGAVTALPEITFTFRKADAPPQHAPTIGLSLNGSSYANVTHVSGAADRLAGLTFTADPASDDLTWTLGSGSAAVTGRGASFSPRIPDTVGRHMLVLRDAEKRERRLEIEVLRTGGLLIGHQGGVADADGAVPLRSVEATYDLAVFHKEGRRQPATEEATLLDPSTVDIPEGALAEVVVERGTAEDPDADPDPVPESTHVRHVQILMQFDSNEVVGWGDARPPDIGEGSLASQLRRWAAQFAGADFVVIGRCDDIGTQNYNRGLADRRARKGKDLLVSSAFGTANAIPKDRVSARGEQTTWALSDPGGAAREAGIVPPLTHEESEAAVSDPGPDGWLLKRLLGMQEFVREQGIQPDTWPEEHAPSHEESERIRRRFRRVDIYAVGGTPASDAPTEPQDEALTRPDLRRALVPGQDATTLPVAKPRDPDLPYRVQLIVRWDSPTVVELADAIPTLAELTLVWQAEPVPLPEATGTVTPVRDPDASTPETFTFVGRWSYDARSGQTLFTLSLDSAGDPDGLFTVIDTDGSGAGNVLATALALGPALMAGIGATGIDGAAVRIGALLAASAAAAVFARNGKVVVFGIQVEQRQRALDSLTGSRQRLLFDYSVEIGFEAAAGGVSIATAPDGAMRVRYKNVGIEIDNARSGLDRLGLVYEDVSFEIENPGLWRINGPLGELLRVTGTRAGSGSTWVEVDLAFALDLGVVTITGATVRLTFDEGAVGVELRGLAAAVDIPGTLRGAGRLSVGDGGLIRAGLDVQIIPADISARGALALQADVGFVAIEVGVIFAVGIPLAQSGLGIYGFIGRFVSNGTRDLPASADPVEREIQWYRRPPEAKYRPERGQWALGLGAVIGTMPDTGFTFNALGMFTVAFPDPSVVFGIDAKFISKPGLPSEQGTSPPPGTLLLLGLISVDDTAVKLGVRGSYEIPKLLRLRVPVSGYFPYPGSPGDAYLRIGADGFEGRVGDPVTLTLLPGTLDVTAWSYLMIEEKRLHRLGGDDRFNFDGFSIGFGSGWGIDWSAGPIRLTASAKLLAGLGTRPLMVVAGVFVRGELSLVVVSVSARGEILLRILENALFLEGSFCGKVDMFFFSIEGCVGIEIGTDPGVPIPEPPSPLLGIDLTDRRGVVVATATDGTPTAEHTAWPDTVPVLHFAHYLQTRMEAGSAFNPTPDYPGPVWSGTTELKYAYRLVGVDIIPAGGAPLEGPLDSAWWLPSHRNGVLNEDPEAIPASEHEGRDLALLSWHPAPWARNLGDGGGNAPGDPSHTIDEVCLPTPEPTPACVLGQNATRLDADRVRLKPDGPGIGALSAYFEMHVRESLADLDMEALLALAAEAGLALVPGTVRALPAPLSIPHHAVPLVAAYDLPHLMREQTLVTTLQFDGRFAPAVVEPDLILALCVDGRPLPDKQTACDSFIDIQPGTDLGTAFDHNELRYESLAPNVPLRTVDWFPVSARDRISELNFSAKGLRITLPFEVENVSARVGLKASSPIGLEAFDAAGRRVGQAQTPGSPDQEFVLKVRGKGIRQVVLTGGGGEGVLLEFCYEVVSLAMVSTPLSKSLAKMARAAGGRFPRVTGTDLKGNELDWKPAVLESSDGKSGSGVCQYLRYRPPHRGPWLSVRIWPWRRTRLAVVSSCAIDWQTAQTHDADQNTRDTLVATWNDRADNNTPARRHLLEPDTEYLIRVRWQWQGWRRSESEPEPPPPAEGAWSSVVEDTYRFRTAAGVALPANPEPVDFFDESVFDPRGVARYLLGFDPGDGASPHFLDDPVRVHFNVDHLPQLLEKYNRLLQLKIRRTDPPAGSLAGLDRPPDIPFTLAWKTLAEPLMEPSDLRMLQAARLSDCLREPPLGGSTGEISVDLEPGAEYDLLLVAAPQSNPDSDRILVARSHFQSSRYRNPSDMLEALGFTTPEPFPIRPQDALITSLLATAPVLGDDSALDDAMRNLGLDPWPLVDTPRTVALWTRNGTWQLAGILLETDEPLFRTGVVLQGGRLVQGTRLAVEGMTLDGTPLAVVRSNAAWTRVLLAPASPVAPSLDAVLTLTLLEPDGPIGASRLLADRPRMALQEGL